MIARVKRLIWPTGGAMARNAAVMFVVQVASRAIAFGIALVAARILGVRDYGTYVYALSWANLLAVPSVLGFDRYLIRAGAMYQADGRWDLFNGLLRRADQLVLGASVILAVAAGLFGLAFVHSSLRPTFLMGLALPVGIALSLMRQGALQGLGHIRRSVVPYLLVQPGLLLLGLAAFHFLGFARLTAFVAMTLNVAAMFVSVAIGSVLLHGSLPSIARKTPRAYEVRGWIQSALPLILIGGILIAGNQIGAIALGTTRSSADIAVYNAAARMSEALTFVLTAVNIPIAPAASRLMTMGDGATLQRIVRKAVRAAVAFSIPIALILVIARGPLLSLFGRGFERGGTALILLVIGQLVNVAAGAVGVLLIMTGHQRTAARGFGLGVLATASLTLGLAPGLGVVGAALGTMLGTIIWNTILAVMTIRRLGINPTVFAKPLLPPGLLSH